MQKLLILHGALGAKAQFSELSTILSEHYDIETMDFYGHGEDSSNEAFSINGFADQVADKLSELGWIQPLVFGYSMGGYVALKLESTHPNSFESIVTLGTKFDWTLESSAKEVKMLNPSVIEEKVPHFAESLAVLHGKENWKTVMHRTAQMMLQLGEEPALTNTAISAIGIPVVLLRGSEDKMVTSEETEAIKLHLPKSFYTELEKTVHPIDQIKKYDLAKTLLHFFALDFSNAL